MKSKSNTFSLSSQFFASVRSSSIQFIESQSEPSCQRRCQIVKMNRKSFDREPQKEFLRRIFFREIVLRPLEHVTHSAEQNKKERSLRFFFLHEKKKVFRIPFSRVKNSLPLLPKQKKLQMFGTWNT